MKRTEALTPPPANRWLDRIGIATSSLCAVHCLASGWLLGITSSVGAAVIDDPRVENVFLAVAMLVGVTSLIPAFRHHRVPAPMAWLVMGLLLLLIIRPLVESAGGEIAVVVAGACCIIRAHWTNATLLARSA